MNKVIFCLVKIDLIWFPIGKRYPIFSLFKNKRSMDCNAQADWDITVPLVLIILAS